MKLYHVLVDLKRVWWWLQFSVRFVSLAVGLQGFLAPNYLLSFFFFWLMDICDYINRLVVHLAVDINSAKCTTKLDKFFTFNGVNYTSCVHLTLLNTYINFLLLVTPLEIMLNNLSWNWLIQVLDQFGNHSYSMTSTFSLDCSHLVTFMYIFSAVPSTLVTCNILLGSLEYITFNYFCFMFYFIAFWTLVFSLIY